MTTTALTADIVNLLRSIPDADSTLAEQLEWTDRKRELLARIEARS